MSCSLCGCFALVPASGDTDSDSGSGSEDPSTSGATIGTSTTGTSTTGTGSTATTETSESDSSGSGTADSSGTEDSGSTGDPSCIREPAQPRHIWISNSPESTISKISTEDLVEEARYLTRSDAEGNPSRTSVNFNGDVAVANRNGGVTVFAGDIDHCPDALTTSTGPDDVVAYPDGCLLWHTPFVYASQRPVAWTAGTWSDETCRYEDTLLWTAGANAAIDVLLLDGDTGDVVETIPIPNVPPNFYGIYGAAVDSEGNFWGSQLGGGWLVNVRLDDFTVSTHAAPTAGYGMTVDHNGMVWTCSFEAARFDPGTETWDVFAAGGSGGCNEDGNGILWLANNPLIGIDTSTGVVQHSIALPEYVHGVAVDFDGFVWGVPLGSGNAYRIDVASEDFETVSGLTEPYSYSDMTGFALQNVSN